MVNQLFGRTYIRRRAPIGAVVVAAAGLVMLPGCATLNAPEPAPAPTAAKAPAPKPAEPALPDVALTADLLYDLLVAEVADQRGEAEAGLEAVVRAANESKDPRLVARATRRAIQSKDYDTALTTATQWTELRPDSTLPQEALAIVYLARGDVEDAENVLTALVNDSKDLGQTYRRIADLMVRQEKRTGFLPILQRLTELNTDNADAWYSLAFFADRDDADKVANEAIENALRIRPNWEDAALAKAGYLVQDEKMDDYMSFTKGFLKDNPKANKYRLHYARTLVDQGKTEEALEQFKQAADADPENADATYAIGILSIQAEEYKQADTYLRRVLEIRPDNDQARLYLGQVATELEKFKDAEQWYTSINSDAYSFEGQRLLGLMKAKQTSVDDAISHLKSLSPRNDEDRIQLFLTQEQLLRDADRLADAREVLDEALTVFPDNGDLLYARALVNAQLEDVETHERDLRKLIKNEPENAHAYNALGYTLADQTDRVEEALVLVKKALELRPEDPFIIDSMGWVQYRLGNLESARDYLQKALAARPDAEIAAHLGEVLWEMGERDEAKKIWKEAMKTSPDNDVLKKTVEKHID